MVKMLERIPLGKGERLYFALYKGNDTFELDWPVKADTFEEATKFATDAIESFQKLTIEILELISVE